MSARKRHMSEQGSATLELVIVIPVTLLLIGAIVMAGRMALAQQAVQAVAYDAARAASVARDRAAATTAARQVAAFSLASNGLSCISSNVSVDTAGFTTAVGQNATVTAAVSCTVRLGDLSIPGIPGTITVDADATSPIDTYREH